MHLKTLIAKIDNESQMINLATNIIQNFDSYSEPFMKNMQARVAENTWANVVTKLNELYNDTFNIIQDYLEYSSKELRDIKDIFEKKWHNLLFGQKVILKDENGQIIEFGGTSI